MESPQMAKSSQGNQDSNERNFCECEENYGETLHNTRDYHETETLPNVQETKESPIAQKTKESPITQETKESLIGQQTNESLIGQQTNESLNGQQTNESLNGQLTKESLIMQEKKESPITQEPNESPISQETKESPIAHERTESPYAQDTEESLNGQDSVNDENDDVCNDTLPDLKLDATRKRERRRLCRSRSLQVNNVKILNQRQSIGHSKLHRSHSVIEKTNTREFQDVVPDFLAQRYTMKPRPLNRSLSFQQQTNPSPIKSLSRRPVSLPILIPETEHSKNKSKVRFAKPLVTNSSRFFCRRNALCDPEQMGLPQELREKVQSEVALRKQSIVRKISNFFTIHLSLNLEEDL
ncbi:hypothetical protein SNE40_010906 [Patella caerulea]|uniref:Uncharacterized protein n=1 Tax=Patella caerulea TaxID=87958 RepID=A0AAN8PVB4_PATCE